MLFQLQLFIICGRLLLSAIHYSRSPTPIKTKQGPQNARISSSLVRPLPLHIDCPHHEHILNLKIRELFQNIHQAERTLI